MSALRRDERAFSVVVGAILLIAIVITLSATVWFMVHKVREDTGLDDEKPELGLKVDNVDPLVTVVRASADLDYVRDLRFGGTCVPTLNGGPMPTLEGRLVTADDKIGCGWGESLVITSSDAKGNAMLFSHTF